jgi:hypothetical protein
LVGLLLEEEMIVIYNNVHLSCTTRLVITTRDPFYSQFFLSNRIDVILE